MGELTVEKAKQLLRLNNVQENVFVHCLKVSQYAKEIAKKIKDNGHEVDLDFVETAALTHDIGRSKTNDIKHAIAGCEILKDHPRHARACRHHIGAGLTKEEAKQLGLPAEDYLPQTLEEEIVAYADKLVDGDKRISIHESIKKFEKRLGKGHPALARIVKLHMRMQELMH